MPRWLATGAVALVCSVVLLVAVPSVSDASTWSVLLASNSSAEAQSGSPPSAPTGVSASCPTLGTAVTVAWSSVVNATNYAVEQSTTSSSSGYSTVASGLTGTSWTSGSLSSGSYWFEVVASIGANWASTPSAPSAQITISLSLVCT